MQPQLLSVKPCANIALGTAALESLVASAGHGRTSPPPRLCPWPAGQHPNEDPNSSPASLHTPIHPLHRERRKKAEEGWEGQDYVPWSFTAMTLAAKCESRCLWSHPTVWAEGDMQQRSEELLHCRSSQTDNLPFSPAHPEISAPHTQHSHPLPNPSTRGKEERGSTVLGLRQE